MIRKLISVSAVLLLTWAFPGPAQSRSRQPKNSGIMTKVDAYMKPVLDVNGFTGFCYGHQPWEGPAEQRLWHGEL